MNPPNERPGLEYRPLALWAWRLLPLFAALAATLAWETWRGAADRDLALRSTLESQTVEWAYVEGLTAKGL